MSNTSNVGDLTDLAKDLEEVFEKHGFDDPAMGIAFTLPENRREVHWITNVSRAQGVTLFQNTANKMRSEVN